LALAWWIATRVCKGLGMCERVDADHRFDRQHGYRSCERRTTRETECLGEYLSVLLEQDSAVSAVVVLDVRDVGTVVDVVRVRKSGHRKGDHTTQDSARQGPDWTTTVHEVEHGPAQSPCQPSTRWVAGSMPIFHYSAQRFCHRSVSDHSSLRGVMKLGRAVGLIAVSCLLGAGFWHLDLVDSRPKQDEVVTESPTELWLRFNQTPDLEQSGISLSGPGGAVELDSVTLADSVSLSSKVVGALEAGEYTVSWRAAPLDDHAVRGRYHFTVEQ